MEREERREGKEERRHVKIWMLKPSNRISGDTRATFRVTLLPPIAYGASKTRGEGTMLLLQRGHYDDKLGETGALSRR
jgi:hypothetical protein